MINTKNVDRLLLKEIEILLQLIKHPNDNNQMMLNGFLFKSNSIQKRNKMIRFIFV